MGLLLCRLPLRLRLPRLRCWASLPGQIRIIIILLYASIQTQYSCQVRTTGYGYPAHCAAEHAKDHKNILFIGNSYTYGNDLPGMVKNLASAAGGFSVSASD